MSVSIVSPKEDLKFQGKYDPAVAEENNARYFLKCDGCGMEAKGTTFDLHETGWSWEMSIDTKEIKVKNSEASCPKCNGAKSEEEMTTYEKAEKDDQQITLSESLQQNNGDSGE